MTKYPLVLIACTAMAACASNQPTAKTFVTGDVKLLTPTSKEHKPTEQVSASATIISVREFEHRDQPTGTAKAVGSTATKDIALMASGNLALLPAAAIAAAVSMVAGSVGNSIDEANAKSIGYEITYQIDGSETTATVIDLNPTYKPVPGARIKVTKTAFASTLSPL